MENQDGFGCFVFVDFENVPEVDLGLIDGKPVQVSLLIGKNQKKVDLALVRQIHRLANQVKLVEVGATGHNALDLTLAFYLGQATQRAPDAQYYIVSKDRDFDPMISHLHRSNLKVSRHDDFALLPFRARPKAITPALSAGTSSRLPEDRRAKVVARLKDPAVLNRPATQKALLRHIKAALGNNASDADAEDILSEMRETSALTIDLKGKVAYASP